MTTYATPLLACLALLTACDPPSNNVGEVLTASTTDTDPDSDSGTDSDSASETGTASPDTGTSPGAEETSVGSASGANTGDMEGGCLDTNYDCFEDGHIALDCGGTLVCDLLEVSDPSLNEFDPDPFGFVNPEAATCILEGLAAGTVGTYAIAVEPGQQNSISHRLEVLTDGTVVVRRQEQEDKSCSGHENRYERQPVSYFEPCLEQTDEALILECVLGAGDSMACVDQGHVCPE